MTGKIGPGAHAIAARTNRIRRIEELECQVEDLTADVDVMEKEGAELRTSFQYSLAYVAVLAAANAELRRQLELAKSDALVERPMAAPDYAHHQGGTQWSEE